MEQLKSVDGLDFEYEPKDKKIAYEIPISTHKYLPDFVIRRRDGALIYIEAKGRWTASDRKKHLLIRQQHPDLDIRFVFQRASNPISRGSKCTYAHVCDGLARGDFRGVEWKWADRGVIPEEWLRE